jgi:hypothetical protein
VKLATFRHPRSWSIGIAIGFPATIVAGAWLVVAAFADGHPVLALGLLTFALFVLVPEAWVVTHIAREIQISNEIIRGKPFLGRTTALSWAAVESAECFAVFTLRTGPLPKVYRLIATGGQAVAFTSEMRGFDQLMKAIGKRTSALEAVTEPPWWRRLVYRGF